jgi:hypothetical protein
MQLSSGNRTKVSFFDLVLFCELRREVSQGERLMTKLIMHVGGAMLRTLGRLDGNSISSGLVWPQLKRLALSIVDGKDAINLLSPETAAFLDAAAVISSIAAITTATAFFIHAVIRAAFRANKKGD